MPPPSKRIYPPPPPMPQQKLPQGYEENTGQAVYSHPITKHDVDPNYTEFSDPVQRLFYAIMGAIPKPQEAIKGLGRFATTSPKDLETQALGAAMRAGSKPGMQKHPAMATGEGFANTLLQFLGIPSESMAQRASTGDISGAVGEGYGTYLAGKGLGKLGEKALPPAIDVGKEIGEYLVDDYRLNKKLKQYLKEEKAAESQKKTSFDQWMKFNKFDWNKPSVWHLPDVDGDWHSFLRNAYNGHLNYMKSINATPEEMQKFWETGVYPEKTPTGSYSPEVFDDSYHGHYFPDDFLGKEVTGHIRHEPKPEWFESSKATGYKPSPPDKDPWSGIPKKVEYLYNKVGEQKGSNPGGVYRGDDGTLRYVKFYPKPEQGYGEVLANRIYDNLGHLGAPDSKMISTPNGEAHISKYLSTLRPLPRSSMSPGARPEVYIDPKVSQKFLNGFAADVLLANWDAVGLNYDNILLDKQADHLFRIDNGGSLLYRAQGALKPEADLSNSIKEVEDFFDPKVNPQYARMARASGYKSAAEIPNIEDQVGNILKMRKHYKGWDKFIENNVPEITGTAKKQLAGILEKRTELLKKRFLTAETKPGHPDPENYDSLKEFAAKRLYGHILNSLYTGFNEDAINRLRNTDDNFEALSEGITMWKGSPRTLQELSGDLMFGKPIRHDKYGLRQAKMLVDAYVSSPEFDYTLYRGMPLTPEKAAPYLALKPGDKLPFFRLHGYSKIPKKAEDFAGWQEPQHPDRGFYSVIFIVEGKKKALNITNLNGFESEAEHLMNGEYTIKQVVRYGDNKKVKIIMEQDRPLYAKPNQEAETKPMGPGSTK